MRRSIFISLLFTLFASTACADSTADAETALRALDEKYVEGWKQAGTAAQDEAIMALFAADAVIRPGLGTPPKRGADEIRAFWFPPDTPATNIIVFDHAPDRVDIEGDLGVISGWYELRFEYGDAQYAQEGNYLTVARRHEDGQWLVTEMIWNDHKLD